MKGWRFRPCSFNCAIGLTAGSGTYSYNIYLPHAIHGASNHSAPPRDCAPRKSAVRPRVADFSAVSFPPSAVRSCAFFFRAVIGRQGIFWQRDIEADIGRHGAASEPVQHKPPARFASPNIRDTSTPGARASLRHRSREPSHISRGLSDALREPRPPGGPVTGRVSDGCAHRPTRSGGDADNRHRARRKPREARGQAGNVRKAHGKRAFAIWLAA